MVVKRKVGRPRKKRIIKSDKLFKSDKVPNLKKLNELTKTKSEEVKEKNELFPDRMPIYGNQDYEPVDTTKLVRNGKEWIPEEHGYVARFMSPEQIKIMGMRDYIPVPKKAGIRIKGHPLTVQEIGNAGDVGDGIYLRLQENEPAQKELCSDELEVLTGGKSKYVKLNSSILCLAPIELVQSRRKFAQDISNNTLRNSLTKAHEEAQEELGTDVKKYGRFTTGRNAERYELDKKTRSPKKIWTVPAQIE